VASVHSARLGERYEPRPLHLEESSQSVRWHLVYGAHVMLRQCLRHEEDDQVPENQYLLPGVFVDDNAFHGCQDDHQSGAYSLGQELLA